MSDQLTEDFDNLRHMLGATGKPRDFGFRNYYNTSDGGPDVESMKRLQAMGLIVPGRPNYWHATEKACRVLGFNEKQIKRALYDE